MAFSGKQRDIGVAKPFETMPCRLAGVISTYGISMRKNTCLSSEVGRSLAAPFCLRRLEVAQASSLHSGADSTSGRLAPRPTPRAPWECCPAFFTLHFSAFTLQPVASPSMLQPTRNQGNPTFLARVPTMDASRPAPVSLYTALFRPAKDSPNKPHS